MQKKHFTFPEGTSALLLPMPAGAHVHASSHHLVYSMITPPHHVSSTQW